MQFGDHRCPKCRCETMYPSMGRRDMNILSTFTWIMVKMNKGCQWLCEKILTYYDWRRTHIATSVLVDYVMCLVTVLAGIQQYNVTMVTEAQVAWNVNFGMRYGQIAYGLWNNWHEISHVLAGVQNDDDDWGLDEYAPRVVVQNDREHPFNVKVNNDLISDWVLRSKAHRVCLHDKLRTHIAISQLMDDHWRVPDDETRILLNVPLEVCEENCKLLREGEDNLLQVYTTIVEHWVAYHRAELRGKIITYYNTMQEADRIRIPEVVRPEWAGEVHIEIHQDWWNYLTGVWAQYGQTITYVGAVIGAISALVGLYGFATRVSAVTNVVSQVSATAGSPERAPRNPVRNLSRMRRPVSYFHAEEDTPTVFRVACGYICRNTFKIDVMVGSKKKEMYGTGLFGHYLLLPRHYVRALRKHFSEGCKIYGAPLAAPQMRSELDLHSLQIVSSEDTDIAYMQLPPKYPLFKDIRKFLALDSDFDTPITSEGYLLANPKSGCEFMMQIQVDIDGIAPSQVIIDHDNSTFEAREVLQYNYSKPGVCGSLLLRENHQRPILSMHFAGIGEGLDGNGYGVILTQESLKALCENQAVPTQFDDVVYGDIDQAKFVFDDDTHLYYYGSVTPELTPYIGTKSKLEKSSVFGKTGLETIMEPAILDKKDPRYIHTTTPLYEGVKKHGKITKDFPLEIVKRAGERYWDMYLSKMKPLVANPKELTLDQCVVGLDIDHYTGMDLTTSAGYPYNLNKQRTLKEHYITVERDAQLKPIKVKNIDPELERIIQEKRNKRKQGIVPHTLFIDTLKDEKRSKEKARSLGGTRVFCSSPVDYVIECRRYFMHFVAAFMDQRNDLMHAVGINPTSDEWSWLAVRLLRKNSKFCTIDYSNFGPGYNSMVAKVAYDLIVRWTMEHVKMLSGDRLDERELQCIVYECLQSMHICNNTVYQQGAGSPSGAFFTTIINTMVNLLYILIAWELLCGSYIESRGKFVAREFKDNVEMCAYGDDGIMAITDEYLELFNMQTIQALFAEYGIVATNAAKDGSKVKFEEVSEAQFLKRGFLLHLSLIHI